MLFEADEAYQGCRYVLIWLCPHLSLSKQISRIVIKTWMKYGRKIASRTKNQKNTLGHRWKACGVSHLSDKGQCILLPVQSPFHHFSVIIKLNCFGSLLPTVVMIRYVKLKGCTIVPQKRVVPHRASRNLVFVRCDLSIVKNKRIGYFLVWWILGRWSVLSRVEVLA